MKYKLITINKLISRSADSHTFQFVYYSHVSPCFTFTSYISGCIALARSHLGTVTSLDERTGVVSRGSMAQAAGFIIGPGMEF